MYDNSERNRNCFLLETIWVKPILKSFHSGTLSKISENYLSRVYSWRRLNSCEDQIPKFLFIHTYFIKV